MVKLSHIVLPALVAMLAWPMTGMARDTFARNIYSTNTNNGSRSNYNSNMNSMNRNLTQPMRATNTTSRGSQSRQQSPGINQPGFDREGNPIQNFARTPTARINFDDNRSSQPMAQAWWSRSSPNANWWSNNRQPRNWWTIRQN